MAQWIEPGATMELKTEDLVLMVVEIDASHITITGGARVEGVAVEPTVVVVDGGFVIDVATMVPAGAH